MAAPDLFLRVPPSGPPVDTSDTSPLEQIAGLVFRSPGDGSADYRNGIGSPGDDPADLGLVYHRADGPALLGTPFNQQPLDAQGDPDAWGLTPGIWRVTARLVLGFDDDFPDAIRPYTGLEGSFFAMDAAGNALASAVYYDSPIPRDLTVNGLADGASPGVVHSVQWDAFLEVTQAMIEANGGNPLEGLALRLNRVTDGGIEANEGVLMFTHDVTLHVSRYR